MGSYCQNNTNTINTTANNCSRRDLIKNTVRKIDQLQKEATLQTACEGCESSLFATIYNTKPVAFYLCNGGTFTALIPDFSGDTTNLFRIEEVKDDGVILRLLRIVEGEVVCTNTTIIFDLDCACGLQCYPAICCEECTRVCGN